MASGGWDRAMWLDASGKLVAGVNPSGSAPTEITGTTALNNGAWHLAAFVDSSSGLSLYVDGSLQTSSSSTSGAQSYSGFWSVGSAQFGGWSDAPPENSGGVAFFNGNLAGVAVVPSALTGAQISTLHSESSFASYTTAVEADSPQHYWGLQDSAPTPSTATEEALAGETILWPDLSASGDNATANGSVSIVSSGPLSASLATSFDGSTGYLTTANSVTSSSNYTEMTWFKTSSSAGGALMGFQATQTPSSSQSNAHDRFLWLDSSGHVWAGGDQGDEVGSTGTYDDGSWHLAAATVSASGLSLYVDGNLIGTNAADTATAWSGYWSIGSAEMASWSNTATLNGSGVSFFNGDLAGVAALSSAMSASQISALYGSSTFNTYTGTLINDLPSAYWGLAGVSDGCTEALVTVAVAVGATTTCLLPAEPTGVSCPSVATGGLPLIDLTTAQVNPNLSLAAGATGTVTIAVADDGTLSSALTGVDILADATLTASAGDWQAGAVYADSQSGL